MRLSNRKLVRYLPGVYYFSVILILSLVFLYIQLGHQLFPSKTYYYGGLSILSVGLVYTYFAAKYFEYDSEGSLVSLVNKGSILSEFINYRTRVWEIKKCDIKSFKIVNLLIYKVIYIHYSSKTSKGHVRANISLLNARQRKLLKLSLERIIAKNQSNL